jgi:Tol biopolymer transport system component
VTRVALACTLALAALASFAGPASADLPAPAPNGLVAFTSGRDDGGTVLSDNLAQIWTTGPFGGTPTRRSIETQAELFHHRHASWSPDRTKIAFARGSAFAGPYDIYIRDLITGSTVPLALTTESEDRPAWSPDGTRIAYQRDLDNSAMTANWVIETRPATGGAPTPVATNVDTTNSTFYPRPHWTPDSQTIFYSKLDAVDATDGHDIFRAPANGSNTTGTVVVDGDTNDYQPEVSPAGDRICFTRDIGNMGDKDVYVASINGTGADSLTAGGIDYECGWSPDTTRILFSRGGFNEGMLMVRNSDATGTVGTLANDTGNNRFDGNGDWTFNPSPTCPNGSASVAFNSFVSIPISCSDVPEPFQTDPQSVDEDIVTQPSNGVLGSLDSGRVIYTPNVNFQGQDSFTFKGSDGTSDSNVATIAITVSGPTGGGGGGGGGGGPTPTCGGQTATIVGTAGIDVLAGTRRRDVIAALGGNDTVRGGRGNDLICAGSGRDRVAAGRGKDRVSGGTGGDRLAGNGGNDVLRGNGGRDRLNGGRGADRLNGGAARDVCRGSLGTDRASRCERRTGIP